MNRRLALSLPATLALAGAAHAAPPVPSDPSRLLQRHLTAFVQNDLDALVADYAHDAVLMSPDATYRGVESIRAFFRDFIRRFPTGTSQVALDHTTFEGDLVYFTWHATTPSTEVPFATDTMVLRGGKIVKQTFAGVFHPAKQ